MSAQDLLDARAAGHHRNLGELKLDKETTSYPAIRGREQIVKDKLAAEGRGTKQIRPISPTNDRLQEYLDAATKEFGGN